MSAERRLASSSARLAAGLVRSPLALSVLCGAFRLQAAISKTQMTNIGVIDLIYSS
jgi:hypothetical protein